MLPTVLVVNTPTVLGTHKLEVDGFTDEFRVTGIPGFLPLSMLAGVALVFILLAMRGAPSYTRRYRTTRFTENRSE